MGAPSGVTAKAAVKRAAETLAWTDSSIGTVTGQIPILSDGLTYEPILDIQEAVVGSAAQQQADIVGYKLQGPISTELWYESLEPLFLATLGYENPTVYTGVWGAGSGGSPAPDLSPTPAAYVHVFECDDVLNSQAWSAAERAASSGLSTAPTYWLATDQKIRHLEVFTYKEIPAGKSHWNQHCYVRRATWRMKPGECAAEWDLVGRAQDRTFANTYTSWALPASHKRCLFPELHVFCSAVGATLTTEWGVREVEITLDNALQDAEFATAASGAVYILEPVRDGTRKITGKMKAPRYTTEQWESWRDAKTALQLRVVLQSTAVITGSALPYTLDFMLPLVYITKVSAPASGPSVIQVDIEFTAVRPTSYQSWMTALLGGVTTTKGNELVVRMVNQMPACYSRDRQAAGVTLP